MAIPTAVRETLINAALRFIRANQLPRLERDLLKRSRFPGESIEALWDGFLEEWGDAAGSAWNEALERLEKSGEIVPQRELEG